MVLQVIWCCCQVVAVVRNRHDVANRDNKAKNVLANRPYTVHRKSVLLYHFYWSCTNDRNSHRHHNVHQRNTCHAGWHRIYNLCNSIRSHVKSSVFHPAEFYRTRNSDAYVFRPLVYGWHHHRSMALCSMCHRCRRDGFSVDLECPCMFPPDWKCML